MKLQPRKTPIRLKTSTGTVPVLPHQTIALPPRMAAKLLKAHPNLVKRAKR